MSDRQGGRGFRSQWRAQSGGAHATLGQAAKHGLPFLGEDGIGAEHGGGLGAGAQRGADRQGPQGGGGVAGQVAGGRKALHQQPVANPGQADFGGTVAPLDLQGRGPQADHLVEAGGVEGLVVLEGGDVDGGADGHAPG
jgi:hypothetical protein